MALRAVHVSDVPNLDQVPENAAFSLFRSSPLSAVEVNGEDEEMKSGFKFGKFMVVGHRGSGMNMLQSSDGRMKSIKENSILSFNSASNLRLDFIEFDVQWLFGSAIEMDTRGLFIPAVCGKRSAYMQRPLTVTKDDCPVIFHDNFILTEDKGAIIEKRTTEITLAEFLSYGPHKEAGKLGKPLFRKTRDGRIFEWKVENDDPLCTLEEVFQKVEHSMGFNIELKFDDQIVYKEEELTHLLQVILNVVNEYAKDRPIIFSSFQPDASLLIRKLQNTYPVFFLTNGGSEIYADIRRNSLDEAIKLCLSGGLQGIVSEVKAVFRNPGAVTRIKESKLALITYGQLNNVPEVVYLQHLMGVEGVIVDLVQEIKEAVLDYLSPAMDDEEDNIVTEKKDIMQVKTKPQFSQLELSFLLKLIRELISH